VTSSGKLFQTLAVTSNQIGLEMSLEKVCSIICGFRGAAERLFRYRDAVLVDGGSRCRNLLCDLYVCVTLI